MSTCRKNRIVFIATSSIALFCLISSGCAREAKSRDAADMKVVAKINNYELTVSDFREEVGPATARKYIALNPEKAKDELLEKLITKKVLLQEAQRQDFDKDRAFMKEIERYWEQALLKLLLKKKSEELSRTIEVEESEIMDEYSRMKLKIFAEVIILADKTIAKRLSRAGDLFDEVKVISDKKIISGAAPEWWTAGDLPRRIEDRLFSLEAGEISEAIPFEDTWVVLHVLRKEDAEVEPFDKLSADIKEKILQRKKEAALDEWVAKLRKDAAVTVYRDNLNAIDLDSL